MDNNLRTHVERFVADSGLSEHRVGILLARNGRLLERLRDPKRKFWPDTVEAIMAAIQRERERRNIPENSGVA